MAQARARANILITGTPGTGKTTLGEELAAATGLVHLDVGKAIREQELHCGWDDEFECHTVDEDKARNRAHACAAHLPNSALSSRPLPAPFSRPAVPTAL